MEKSGAETRIDLDAIGGNGNGQRIDRRRVYQPAARYGCLEVVCDICGGKGTLPVPGYECIDEVCVTCDGHGTAYVSADRRSQTTWSGVLLFSLACAGIVAGFCKLLAWMAGGN